MEKEFFVITVFDGEPASNTMNVKELAELYLQDNISGMYDEIIAYHYNPSTHAMDKIDVHEVASAFLRQQKEIDDEYRDYCEAVNEYGYDYYESDDNLEMGFDPYAGCYSDDC